MDFERYYSGRAVVFRAFPVSLMVMLRMAPILAAVGLVATGLFASVASNWIALAMVVFLTIAPITYFVILNTIRAALVQIG